MENELRIFEGIELDILTKDDVNIEFNGECLFSGKQVCNVLQYVNDRDAISSKVRENQKVKVKNSDVVNNNFRKLNNAGETFLTENGVVELIQKSLTKSLEFKTKLLNFLYENNYIERKLVLYDRKELIFLDKLEKSLKPFDIVGEKQYYVKNENGTNYRIDYYIPELNIAIEYDENGHADYTYEQHEGRQEYIENKLGCRFVRVTDKESDEYNIGKVIKEIFEMDNNKCNLCGCNMELLNGKYICSNCGSTKKYNPVYKF